MRGVWQTPGGLSFEYEYHYNRNALRSSRVVGGYLVALTDAGHLLRFDLPSIEFSGELISAEPYTALGSGVAGGLIGGRRDGHVYRIDPATLEESWIGQLPGEPSWLQEYAPDATGSPALVAVLKRSNGEFSVYDASGPRRWDPEYPQLVHVAHLDRRNRLWLGADNGEFGGWIGRIDLPRGRLRDYNNACGRAKESELRRWILELVEEGPISWCDGVYGFLERPNGRVWAYGGVSHMGFHEGYVLELGRFGVTRLAAFGDRYERLRSQEDSPEGEPRGPVTELVEHAGELLLFSYDSVYRAAPDLSSWEHVRDIRLRYFFGRPDAVGAYPSIRGVHVLEDPTGPVLLSTRRDGLVLLWVTEVASRALPAQLEATRVVAIEEGRDGLVYLDGRGYSDLNRPWRRMGDRWERIDLETDREPQRLSDRGGAWLLSELFLDEDARLVGVFETNYSPGERLTVRWEDSTPRVLAESTTSNLLGIHNTFVTPDGLWWGELWRGEKGSDLVSFVDGAWRAVGAFPEECSPCWLELAATTGPPWLLLDTREHQLWELDVASEEARLRPLQRDGEAREVYATLSLPDGDLLLATDAGLRQLDRARGTMRKAGVGEPAAEVRALGRDGRGRTWLGGHGLWVLDAKSGRPEAVAGLPLFPGSEVAVIARDPHDPSGVIVSLGDRGVLFVRVPL